MDSFFVCSLLAHSPCCAFKITSRGVEESITCEIRETLFSSSWCARACWKNVSLENNALSDEDTNSKNTRTKRNVVLFVNAFARTLSHFYTRSRRDARLHSPEIKFPVLHKVKFRVFGVRPDLGFKSDIRLPQNIQLSLTQRERERETEPFIRSVAKRSHRRALLFIPQTPFKYTGKAKHLNTIIQNVIG